MNINQFAVYQVKEGAAYRHLRFRSYDELSQNGFQVDVGNYQQVYLSQMSAGDTAEGICQRLRSKRPRSFKGRAVSVSDVIVLNRSGTVSSFYVDKEKLIVLADFFRLNSSGTLVTMETKGHTIKGKPGTWLASDDVVVDGRHFFLMQNEQMKNTAACTVVDAQGTVIVEAAQKFDENTLHQIREYLNPPQHVPIAKEEKPPLENWQKSFENGEYLRAVEMTEEQNYSFIDGRMNNMPSKKQENGKKPSILKRLHDKQAEISIRMGKAPQQMMMGQESERNRK